MSPGNKAISIRPRHAVLVAAGIASVSTMFVMGPKMGSEGLPKPFSIIHCPRTLEPTAGRRTWCLYPIRRSPGP